MRDLVAKLASRSDLTQEEAADLLAAMTDPELDPVLAASALTSLRVKGETADEVRAFALGLRELALRPHTPPEVRAVDVVGTGGDGSHSFNLSTGSALLAASAGLPVIKHGNRSVSSQSGSADVLAALGVPIPLDQEDAGELFERTGFTFLFAPAYHPAMAAIGPVRRALGIRTIFNIAGPLANPASPPLHVIGCYSLDMARVMAETLSGMPIERAFVLHGEPGWDEPTPIGPYHLLDVTPGSVDHKVEDPIDFGLDRCDLEDLGGGDAAFNAAALKSVFAGESGPHRDALVLGAALALRVAGEDPERALQRADAAIDDGSATRLLEEIDVKTRV
ncbi:MAG: anthranilate phosphoribosyltransferase [Actinomycetota bacterium]|nr:anthranilate phosphoribosyltransferase [Actinomycetota bacterium]